MSIQTELQKIRERAEKATPGPWLYRSDTSSEQAIECEECGTEFPEQGYSLRSTDQYEVLHGELYGMESLCKPNGEFIAHARTDIPRLLACVERLVEELEWLKEPLGNRNDYTVQMVDDALVDRAEIALSDVSAILTGESEKGDGG